MVRALMLTAAVGLLAAGCKKDREDEAAEPAREPAPSGAEPSGPEPEEPPPTESAAPSSEQQAIAEQAAAIREELGKIAEAAKGNCDKAAAAMKAHIDRNKDVLAAAAKLGDDPAIESWLKSQYGPRMDAANSKLMPLMERCADHDGVSTVFDAIE